MGAIEETVQKSETKVHPKLRRVLYVANSGQIGGGNRSLLTLLRHLDRASYQPVVVCPFAGPMVDAVKALDIPCRIIPPGNPSKWRPWRIGIEIFRYLCLIQATRADIVHTNSVQAWFAPGIAARLLGRRKLSHLRYPLTEEELRWLAKRSAAPDRIIANSDSMRLGMSPIFDAVGWDNRCQSVPNAVDLAAYNVEPDEESERDDRPLRVLFASNLDAWKGPDLFLNIAAKLCKLGIPAEFQIAGDDIINDGAYRCELETMAAEMGLGSRVEFLGFRDDMPRIYRNADVLLWPARRLMREQGSSGGFAAEGQSAGFPRVAIEAMACSTAVVAAGLPGVSEAVVDNETGYVVTPEDDDAFVEAIRSLAGDRARCRALGKNGRRRAEEYFSAERHAERIQAIYDSLFD